jgi:hypothetical protein
MRVCVPFPRRRPVQDAADGVSVEGDLEAGAKVLDSADLDFSRYADTLFEVLFAGGRLSTGGNLADDQKEKLATNVRQGFTIHICSLHLYLFVFRKLSRLCRTAWQRLVLHTSVTAGAGNGAHA